MNIGVVLCYKEDKKKKNKTEDVELKVALKHNPKKNTMQGTQNLFLRYEQRLSPPTSITE